MIDEEKKTVDPTPHETGHTTPQVNGSPTPRLPHEHDESSDSQTSPPRAVIQQAHKDLQRGLVDTDRGPLMDKLYKKQVQPADGSTPHHGAPEETVPAKPNHD